MKVRQSIPFMTPCAARNIVAVNAVEKMIFCPEFRYAKDVVIFTEDASYCLRCLSYCAISNFSLLKCCNGVMQMTRERAINKYLDSLVIYERVNGHSRSFIVRFIGIAAKLRSEQNE